MDNKTIAGAVATVGLVGATMFGAGTLVGDKAVALEPTLEKIDASTVKEIKTVETLYDTSEVGKEIESLQARKEMNLIKITTIQADNAKIDEEIAKKQAIINKAK